MDINIFDTLNISESITPVVATSRYWVGGSGTWDSSSTANWSTTSGGSAGASAPRNYNDVFFDSNSGGGTVTMGANVSVLNLDMRTFTGTFTGAYAIITLGTSITLKESSGDYFGSTTILQINSANNVKLTSNGSPFGGRLNINQVPGTGFTTYLQDNLLGLKSIYMYYGGLNTNNFNLSAEFLYTYTTGGAKFLTLGSSTVTLNPPSSSTYSIFANGLSGTLTLDAGTSTIKFSGGFYGQSKTFYNVETIGTANIFNSFYANDLKLAGGYTATFSAGVTAYIYTLTSGGSNGNLAVMQSGTAGTDFHISSRTDRQYKVYYMSIKDCYIANTSWKWVANKSTDVSGNTNWIFGNDRYWVGGTDSWNGTAGTKWAATSGGTGGETEPTNADDVYFDAASGSGTVTIDTTDVETSKLDFTGFSGTISGSTKNLYVYDNFILTGSTTWNFSKDIFFTGGFDSSTIYVSDDASLNINSVYITSYVKRTLTNHLFVKQLTMNRGIFDSNNYNIYAQGYSSTITTYSRTILMRGGQWNIVGNASLTAGYCWNVQPTNLTIDPGTSTIQFRTDATVTNKPVFYGGGMTYYNLDFHVSSSKNFEVYTSNTFNTISADGTVGASIYFEAGTTQTLTNLSVNGYLPSVMTKLKSITPGSPFTLSKSSGTVSGRFLELQDSTATGGATWNALQSTDVSGNTGWNFLPMEINASDSINISENVSVSVQILLDNVSVSDSINVSENTTTNLQVNGIEVSDSLNISEGITTYSQPNDINIIDTIDTYEDITRYLQLNDINIFDSVDISENIDLINQFNINVFDSINTSESTLIDCPLSFIDIFDAVSASEGVIIFRADYSVDYLNIDDVVVVDLDQLGDTNIDSSISISDSVDIVLLSLVSVSDTLNISENYNFTGSTSLSVSDTLNVSENIIETTQLGNISINDSLNISENISSGTVLAGISTNDSISIAESISRDGRLGDIVLHDSVGMSENNLGREEIKTSAFSSINIAESSILELQLPDIYVSDQINLSEGITRELTMGGIIVFDSALISVDINTDVFIPLTIHDSIAMSDGITLESFKFSVGRSPIGEKGRSL